VKKHNLHHQHDWHDQENELQYIIMRRQHPTEIIVAFRGLIDSFALSDLVPFRAPSLVSRNRRQMLMMTELVPVTGTPGHIHEGTAGYFARMLEDLDSFFTPEWMQENEGVPIICTGFSMGSGLALLTALRLQQRGADMGIRTEVSCINFASPKPGDHALVVHAQEKLKTYQTYFVRMDPIASFPGVPGYVNGGDLIVFVPNAEKLVVNGEVPMWLTEYHPYSDTAVHTCVTDEKFSVGTVTIKDAALPTWGSLRNAGKYHRMTEVKAILDACPAPAAETARIRDIYAKGKGAAVPPVANSGDEDKLQGGWFSCFPASAPGKKRKGQGPEDEAVARSRCACGS
jgi:hypothetical protein